MNPISYIIENIVALVGIKAMSYDSKLLDLACGDGNFSSALLDRKLAPSKGSVIKILSIVKENNDYPRLDSFLANLLKYLYKKPKNT